MAAGLLASARALAVNSLPDWDGVIKSRWVMLLAMATS
jgi:hypothetical protein